MAAQKITIELNTTVTFIGCELHGKLLMIL